MSYEKQTGIIKIINVAGAWILATGILIFLNFLSYKILAPTFYDVGIDFKNLQAIILTLTITIDIAILLGSLSFLGIKAWKYFKGIPPIKKGK